MISPSEADCHPFQWCLFVCFQLGYIGAQEVWYAKEITKISFCILPTYVLAVRRSFLPTGHDNAKRLIPSPK